MALTKIGKEGITGISNSANATAITISADEEVTMPLQPAFMAGPASAITNPAHDSTITLDSEAFDIGSNFASNTFTAPVTGKYQLNVVVRLQEIDDAINYTYVTLKTSNRFYYNIISPTGFDSDMAFLTLTISVLADMDANDTAFLTFHFVGGSQTIDIADFGNGTVFSGILVG